MACRSRLASFVIGGYGSTEVGGRTAVTAACFERHEGAAGYVLPWATIEGFVIPRLTLLGLVRSPAQVVTITVATWVHELDKVGRLDMHAPDVAYIYQDGRIAAQEVKRQLLPRLQSTIDDAIGRATSLGILLTNG